MKSAKEKAEQRTSERVSEPSALGSDQDWRIYLFHRATYHFCVPYVRGLRVLDFGCGTGHGSACLARHCTSVIGVDVSEAAIEYATARYCAPNLNFRRISRVEHEPLPFSKGEFDAVVSLQVIEHITDPHPYLREIQRVLGARGVLILATPNRSLRLFALQKPWNPFHIREYEQNALSRLLMPYFREVEVFHMSGSKVVVEPELRRVRRRMWLMLPLTLPFVPERFRVPTLRLLSNTLNRVMRAREGDVLPDESDIIIRKSAEPSLNLVLVARK